MRAKNLIRLAAAWGALAGVARLRGEQPMVAPAPLSKSVPGVSLGTRAMNLTAADAALEFGFSSQAADLYRELLAQPGADRAALTLSLATALLEGGRAEEAEKALVALPEPHNAGWYLRMGLAALQQKKYDGVRATLGPPSQIKETELPVADYPWYWFLQGAYVELFSPQEMSRANDFYHRAEDAPGISDLARARFQLAAEEMRLRRAAPPTAEQLKASKDNADRLVGTLAGFSFAQQYALMLAVADRRGDALSYLQTVLPSVPKGERWWDDLRLTVGLIGDRGRSFAARKALTEIVESGNDPKRQRQALQLLWEASQAEPARSQLRGLLDRLTTPASKHPILESLLFYRAQLALVEKRFDDVAGRTAELLEKFPGSPLRVQALGLTTRLAWEQQKFRTAAANARKARAELADAKEPRLVAARAELTLVEAEAWFRAGMTGSDRNDFRNAADAYEAALRERPANVKAGDLMFQRVLAEIKAGSSNAAQVLDQLETDAAFDVENRWQAEWSLARALLPEGKTTEAYARVTKLLAEKNGAVVGAELRARMAWLQTRLSLEANQPQQTLVLVDALLGSLGDLEGGLRTEIASTALLRKAEAQFRLGREASGNKATDLENAALATLQKVRTDYSGSDAAVQTYLIEAEHYSDSDRIQEAQKTLTALTENAAYRDKVFIPYAYYQLALLSERLGQTKDLEEAHRRIEDMMKLMQENPALALAQADLIFAARMKEGELLRRLNEFPVAQQVYESLIIKPASTENETLAKLELAKTHNAQSAGDTSSAHADSAQSLFAQLCERQDAAPDVAVEAGYNLGALLVRRGKLEEAARVWWRDVVTKFLLDEKRRIEPAATRPYWLARTLIELGALYEQLNRSEDARRAYNLVETSQLGWGEALAKKGLERLGAPPAKG